MQPFSDSYSTSLHRGHVPTNKVLLHENQLMDFHFLTLTSDSVATLCYTTLTYPTP